MNDIPQVKNKPVNSLETYKRLIRYFDGRWYYFRLSIYGAIIYSASNLLFLQMFEDLVDQIGQGSVFETAQRLYFPLVLIAIVLTRGVGGFLNTYYMAWLANTTIHTLRTQLLSKFLRLPVPFYDKNNAGHLMSTVSYNTQQVHFALTDSTVKVTQEGSAVIGLLAYMFWGNWKLTLTFLLVTPLITLVVLYASKKFRKHSNRIQLSMGDVTQVISETIKGMRVIRTFGAEKAVDDKFVEASNNNRTQNLKLERTLAISTPVVQVVVASSLAFLIWLAMSPAFLGNISSGEFVSFILAAGLTLKPIRQLSRISAPIQKGLAAAESIFVLLDEDSEKDTGTYTAERVNGDIEYRDVHFRYERSGNDVLHGLSFHCEAGKTTAIVGKSGSGKTTLVNLLPRFYELTAGDILIDGVAVTDYTLANLRSHIALVSQQVVLFNGSVKDNVAYGELAGTSDERVTEALQHANAMEFIDRLPEGIHTVVGDDGVMLSGGQRQRLAIARALLKDAPILILDEATSALDTESERYIQSALDELMKGRTTFVIAHRLSTIENADQILVMDAGKIVEQGNHQTLLDKKGVYAKLHSTQFLDEDTAVNEETV